MFVLVERFFHNDIWLKIQINITRLLGKRESLCLPTQKPKKMITVEIKDQKENY